METLPHILEKSTGITCDSNAVKKGDIFVAINGRLTDGNQFAAIAESKGAIAVISDNTRKLPFIKIPVFPVENARHELAKLSAHLYRHPSNSIKLIGVTGSNGKTTVAHMLDHIFNCYGLQSGLIGTVHIKYGDKIYPSKLTTPAAHEFQSYLAEMRDNGVTHAVMEVSAQGMDLHRTDFTRYTCGVLTNICADHLDFHGSFENYLLSKAKFLKLLGPCAPLIVNVDDSYCKEFMDKFNGRKIKCSMETLDADYSVTNWTMDESGLRVIIREKQGLFPYESDETLIHLPLLGKHNVENILMAYATARFLNLEPEKIASSLKCFPGVDRRMKVINKDGITVIDDTALNPGSIDAVLNTISNLQYNRIYVINAIRGNRGHEINIANALAISEWKRKLNFNLVITSSLDYVGHNDQVYPIERECFLNTLHKENIKFLYFEELNDSIKYTVQTLMPGDLLVLMGAQGMDEGQKVFMEYLRKQETVISGEIYNLNLHNTREVANGAMPAL